MDKPKQHKPLNALIDPQCTKRDAHLASMQMGLAVAIISAATFAVPNAQFATTVPAAEYAVQQRRATAYGPSHHQTLAIGIIGYHSLIPLVLLPRDIPFVMVNKNR